MARKQTIPPEVQIEAQVLIDRFNQKHFGDPTLKEFGISGYSARFRGKYLYLDRDELGEPSPICRLAWNGQMDNWDFAIYKYSDNRYDPEDWFFPGLELVDGTITGAMKAGMEAYPM